MRMRYGFTTGSCAAAASKAAAYMLLTGKKKETISIVTPKGIVFETKLLEITRKEKSVSCAVEKDGGDGTHFSYMEVLNMVHHVCEDAGKGYSSMSQDVMNCRKTEIDAINGAIVEQAKLYNVAAPYNRLIVDLIHAIEESYKYQK